MNQLEDTLETVGFFLFGKGRVNLGASPPNECQDTGVPFVTNVAMSSETSRAAGTADVNSLSSGLIAEFPAITKGSLSTTSKEEIHKDDPRSDTEGYVSLSRRSLAEDVGLEE